ncbi:MAG: helix-turn-helix domain-containing protein [Clostridia bacterium]
MFQGKKHIFIRIFLSYLSILLIAMVILTIVYNICMSSIRQNAEQQFTNSLTQTVNFTNSKLEEVESVFNYIIDDDNVYNILMNSEDVSAFDLYLCSQNLYSFDNVSSAIKSVIIFDKNMEYIISNNIAVDVSDYTIKNSAETFNGIYIFDENNIDIINEVYFNPSYLKLNTSEDDQNFILTSVISEYSLEKMGTVAINIDNSYLEELLYEINTDSYGLSYILNKDFELVSSVVGEDCSLVIDEDFYANSLINEFVADDYTLYFVQSENNSWYYCTVVSDIEIYGEALVIQSFIVLLNIILIFSGIAIACLFSKNDAELLVKLMSYLSAVNNESYDEKIISTKKRTYQYIDKSVSGLVNSHIDMLTSLELQKPLLEAAALRNLLLNEWEKYDKNEIKNELGLDFYSKTLLVIVKNRSFFNPLLDAKTRSQFFYSQVKKMVLSQNANTCHVLDLDREQCVFLFILEDYEQGVSEKNIRNMLETVLQNASNPDNSQVLFFMSDVCHSVSFINSSYNQVIDLSRRVMITNNKFIYNTSDELNESFYEYSLETELKLNLFAKNGDLQKVKEILSSIYETNFVNRSLSTETLRQLLSAMEVALIKNRSTFLLDEETRNAYEILRSSHTVNDKFNSVVNVYTSICNNYSINANSKENAIVSETIAFIKKNYSNHNLSVNDVCKEFDLSESGIYKILKDNLGSTFAETLENIRIEKACEFLRTSNISVKEVSTLCGYTSDVTFRRAFKRCMSISPSEYSKSIN